jgi:hypothetical protein
MTTQRFATLDAALDWLMPRWQERPIPYRINDWTTEGVGLYFSASFGSYLAASPGQVTDEERSAPCQHPMRKAAEYCPQCSVFSEDGRPLVETGVVRTSTARFRFPMWRAMRRLEKDRPLRPYFPAPASLIVLCSITGWDARRTAALLGLSYETTEALLLMALRKLHSHYSEGPVGVRKSEAQLNAEAGAA